MAIAATLKAYLDEQGIRYDIIEHRRTDSTLKTCEVTHVPGDLMAKSVLLEDDESYLMAVIPATHRLRLDRLNEITGRQLQLVDESDLVEAFADCEFGAIPPTGKPYGIVTYIDQTLADRAEIYFETGDHTKLMHISGDQFLQLANEILDQGISSHL